MAVCWAECLGGCSPKQSREHLVSESLFPSGVVEVQGFPWCKDRAIRIGSSGIASKILCEKHNNDLSLVDTAALRAADQFREFTRLSSVRRKMKPRPFRIVELDIDGMSFERWCLKTLINLCFDRGHAIGRDSTVAGMPSERLVRIVYGLDVFEGRAGLYSVTRVGMVLKPGEIVQFMPLLKNDLNVEAGVFSFWGTTLLLFLEKEGVPVPLSGLYMGTEHLGDAAIHFRKIGLDMKFGSFVSHKLRFKWS